MNYAIVFEQDALDDLSAVPSPLLRSMVEEIMRLAEGPGRVRTRATWPPYAAGQLFQTEFTHDGITCLMDVVFKYSQDEQTLHISRIYVEYQ